MDENPTGTAASEESSHPLIADFHQWQLKRCARQTKTTVQAVNDAYLDGDVELLETYDRLLGDKDGAWIRHLVKTVRKNPELGAVQNLKKKHLLAYADMHRAIHGVVYAHKKKTNERNWEQENELKVFAVTYPEHVAAVTAVMDEQKTLDLQCINDLITERNNAHNSLVEGVL